jgi:hypothetical protein
VLPGIAGGLFTTAARITGMADNIPADRAADGIHQTALFLISNGPGGRKDITRDGGRTLAAVRYEDLKVHIE